MNDREFLKVFAGLMGSLVALTVILIILAQMVVSSSMLSKMQASSVAKNIRPVGQLNVSMADAGGSPVMNAIIPPANAAAPAADKGKQVYEGTCVACHGAGVAGAPKFGDKAAWKEHIAKGLPTLEQHAIHGFSGKKGFMPAKGGNTSLSDADVKAAVHYMVNHSK